jgi:hypothetical protein
MSDRVSGSRCWVVPLTCATEQSSKDTHDLDGAVEGGAEGEDPLKSVSMCQCRAALRANAPLKPYQ